MSFAGALIVILGVLAFLKFSQYNDRARFLSVEQEQVRVSGKLSEYLGDKVVSTEGRNVCFNTEQGPYDNGRLWCQTTTVITLDADIDQHEVGDQFVAIAQSENLKARSSTSYGVPRYWFDVDKGISCVFTAVLLSGDEISGATYRPFVGKDAPAVAVSCADRAKAKHYQFIDS